MPRARDLWLLLYARDRQLAAQAEAQQRAQRLIEGLRAGIARASELRRLESQAAAGARRDLEAARALLATLAALPVDACPWCDALKFWPADGGESHAPRCPLTAAQALLPATPAPGRLCAETPDRPATARSCA